MPHRGFRAETRRRPPQQDIARHSKTVSGRVPGAHLGWFPLDGRRLPNLSNDLPDPFATGLNSATGTEALFAVHPSKVHFAPLQRSEDSLKWSLDLDFQRNQNQLNNEIGLQLPIMRRVPGSFFKVSRNLRRRGNGGQLLEGHQGRV